MSSQKWPTTGCQLVMLISTSGLASMISWQTHIFISTRWVMAWSVTWSCKKCHSSGIPQAQARCVHLLQPIGYAVTCFILKDADSKGPRLPYDTLLQYRHLKLYFCVNPAHAGTIESATKRARILDTVVKHSKSASVVAVGEIGIDIHCNQTQKARDNCKLFLDALLTALQQDTVLKTKPLVLHVREAEDGSNQEAAAFQCISPLWMARVPSDHGIYLHCFVGSQSVANMWNQTTLRRCLG